MFFGWFLCLSLDVHLDVRTCFIFLKNKLIIKN